MATLIKHFRVDELGDTFAVVSATLKEQEIPGVLWSTVGDTVKVQQFTSETDADWEALRLNSLLGEEYAPPTRRYGGMIDD